MDTYKKIDLGIKFFGLIGIAVTCAMFLAYKDKMYIDNEKARRELSFNIALNVEEKIGMGLYCAYFLSDLSEYNLKQVLSFDEVDIDNEQKNKLDHCLAGQKKDDLLMKSQKKDHSRLTKLGSYYVYHQTFHALNLLEILASACDSGIIDKDIIDNLYGNTLTAKPVESFISKLNSVGQENYLNLEKYIKKTKDYPPGKSPLGDNQ